MEAKKELQECSSIDENPVAFRTVDTDQARKNLQKLQDHVNRQFSNLGPYASRAMNSGNEQSQSNSSSLMSCIDLPSIKDDDLFKGESDDDENAEEQESQMQGVKINTAVNNGVDDKEELVVAGGSNIIDNRFESENKSGCAVGGNIPYFSEIEFSFKSSDTADHSVLENKNEPESVKETEDVEGGHSNNQEISVRATNAFDGNRENFDFKVHYRGKRSQSDIKGKRLRFSQHSDIAVEEVPVFEEKEYPVPVRKSNSLPDLILSLSSSNSSPKSISDRRSPDVVFNENQQGIYQIEMESLRDRQALKDSFEGKSSFEKPDTSNGDTLCRKHAFGRSVSFNEKTDCRYYESEEPALTPGGFKENEKKFPLQDNSHISILHKKPGDEKDPGQNKDDIQSPKSRKEGRNPLLSKSSGYQTGSEQSHESHDAQNESCEKTDFEGSDKEMQMHYLKINNTATGTYNSRTSQSSLSVNTVIEIRVDESDRYVNDFHKTSLEEPVQQSSEKAMIGNPSPELPCLSIMNTSPQSSLNEYRVEKKSIPEDSSFLDANLTEAGKTAGEDLQEHLLMKPLQSAFDFRRSQSTLGQSMPGSIGNMPKFGILDESVLLGPSVLAAVDEADKKQVDHVRRRYVGGTSNLGMLESLAYLQFSRQSLSSNYWPNTLVIQEFEEMIKKNDNEPEKLNAAIRKLYESSSSSPGHSPLECGSSCHCPSSPRSKFFTIDELERASRCSDIKCPEKACEKMRQFNLLMQLDLEDIDRTTYIMLCHFLDAIYQHRLYCEDFMCPVLYCQRVLEWCPGGFDPSCLLHEIKAYKQNSLSYLEHKSEPRFIKLQDSIADTVPQQFVTYIPLSFLQESGKMLLIQDLQKNKLCVIKEYPLFEDNHRISSLESLRNLDHPHMVPQYWMLEYMEESVMHICSQFMQGGSLREYLDIMGGLPWIDAALYLKQISDAVCFLHRKSIIFLHWQSSSMVFPNTTREVIKLSDFAFSHCTNAEPDIGALKLWLPFNLCPPELLINNRICEKSDSWGIACLLAEMLTGVPVWYDLRHEDRETAHKKMNGIIPKIEVLDQDSSNKQSSLDPSIILNNCWKLNPEERCSMDQVDEFLKRVLAR